MTDLTKVVKFISYLFDKYHQLRVLYVCFFSSNSSITLNFATMEPEKPHGVFLQDSFILFLEIIFISEFFYHISLQLSHFYYNDFV
jgi:hypothetical protein